MVTNQYYVSDLAIPPGEYLQEVVEELGMSQVELAHRLGRPSQAVNEIIRGEKAITPETALQLEQVTGVAAHVWTGLEAEYRLIRARQREEEQIEAEVGVSEKFPFNEIVKQGFVAKTRVASEKVRELRRFFSVASLHNLNQVADYAPAFRQGKKGDASPYALVSWLRMAELRAREIETAPYNKTSLLEALPKIRALTKENPEIFLPALSGVLASCGVALVVQPHLPKTYAHGATFWLTQDKAVLVMTLRGSWADIFWFSLFHEIGHIVLHNKRQVFLEDGATDPDWQKQENEADAFARRELADGKSYAAFVVQGRFTQSSIRTFAESAGIAPGIVTGFLQHDKLLPHTVHWWRTRYKWIEE